MFIGVLGCGMATHIEVTHRAHFYSSLANNSLYQILSAYPEYAEAGSFFPDWGYACGSTRTGRASETAHWLPFWNTTMLYIRTNYPQPWSADAKRLISFLLGIVSHGVADVLWHSLWMDEGFIDASSYTNFNESFQDAHGAADVGGEWMIRRFGDQSYAQLMWHIPAQDLVKIYALMGQSVSYQELNLCAMVGYAGFQGGRLIGHYLFPAWAIKEPFFTDKYFDYHLGGIHSMAVSVADCYNLMEQWLLNNTGNPPQICEHMDHNWTPYMQQDTRKTDNLVTRVYNYVSSIKTSRLVVQAKETFQDKYQTVFRFATKVITGAIFGSGCQSIDSQPVYLISRLDYSKFGKSMVQGDFTGTGIKQVVIGAPGYTHGRFPQQGSIFVLRTHLFGPGQHYIEDHALEIKGPEEQGAQFGYAMTVVDLNADGIDDLAISAPFVGYRGNKVDGMVYVLFGRKNAGLRTDGFDLVINGTIGHPPSRRPAYFDDQHHAMGERLFAIDLDGDGALDLVVGSPSASVNPGNHQRGLVQVYLSSSRYSGNINHTVADWTLSGSQNYEWFGSAIQFIPRTQQLLVGAPGYRSRKSDKSNGRVYGFQLQGKRAPTLVYTVTSDVNGAQFGETIVVDDVYLKNNVDVLVSAPIEQSDTVVPRLPNLIGTKIDTIGYQGGVLRVFDFANLTGDVLLERGELAGRTKAVLQGSSSVGHFGQQMTVLPDRRGILVSEKYSDGERGKVHHVIYGADFGSGRKCIEGGALHEQFGSMVLPVDLDANPMTDILVSSDHSGAGLWSKGITSGKVLIKYNFV
ncbi:hypothetical protein EDD86DRAFT_206850 [Gorgonomyces haynaldii]|nr:hypothetical protein EDD86DRAFT_206850 [Gorgonomyces haynaldii]